MLFGVTLLASAITLSMSSCDKSKTQEPQTPQTEKATPTDGMKIAYVEVDSIMNTLEAKQRQLQAAAANFQQKVQQNAYTQEQAQSIGAGLQKQQNDLQVLNQRLSNEFQVETEKYNKALRDSIQHFLAEYNKDKKYALILSKAGDNILYANESYNITKDVIAGLNKAYKPSAAMKKEDKK